MAKKLHIEDGAFDAALKYLVSLNVILYYPTGSRYVSVFNVSGEFIHRFGASNLECPEGIVVDEDGFVYVADSNKKAIFIF